MTRCGVLDRRPLPPHTRNASAAADVGLQNLFSNATGCASRGRLAAAHVQGFGLKAVAVFALRDF